MDEDILTNKELVARLLHAHTQVIIIKEPQAVAFAHDVQGLRRRQHRPVAGAGVVGVAVGDHRARHRTHRVDVEVAGRAIEPLGLRAEQVLGADHLG